MDYDIDKEEFILKNGKSIIHYINLDGSPSTKNKAPFMCEYIYDDSNVLISHNISNNIYLGIGNSDKNSSYPKEDLSKIKRIDFNLSVDIINKLEELASERNITSSKMISYLVEKEFNDNLDKI